MTHPHPFTFARYTRAIELLPHREGGRHEFDSGALSTHVDDLYMLLFAHRPRLATAAWAFVKTPGREARPYWDGDKWRDTTQQAAWMAYVSWHWDDTDLEDHFANVGGV